MPFSEFESSVISYGNQTFNNLTTTFASFESGVISYFYNYITLKQRRQIFLSVFFICTKIVLLSFFLSEYLIFKLKRYKLYLVRRKLCLKKTRLTVNTHY